METHAEVCVVDSWDSLETIVRREPVNVVVFNPAADGTMDVARACRLIRKFSSIPFVAYVPLDACFARGIAHMSNEGLQDLFVFGSNDALTRIRETLARVSSLDEMSMLLEKLDPALRCLPLSLERILVDDLRQPHKYASAEDLAASAGLTVSGLYRSFRQARFSSPKHFVVGARVFRGYLYLKDVGFSIRDVAVKLGYTHPRIFAHQIERVLGERPSHVRRALDTRATLRRLELWFLNPAGTVADIVADNSLECAEAESIAPPCRAPDTPSWLRTALPANQPVTAD
jgi:AraC-like DNA-binding protein